MNVYVTRENEKAKINWKKAQLVVKSSGKSELIVLTTGEDKDRIYFSGTVMHAGIDFKSVKCGTHLKSQSKEEFEPFYGQIKIQNYELPSTP